MPAADQQDLYIKGNARRMDLRIGAVLPDGAEVASATLNGSPVKPKLVKSAPGLEASVSAKPEQRTATLVINVDS
jgi:hypothetical protein